MSCFNTHIVAFTRILVFIAFSRLIRTLIRLFLVELRTMIILEYFVV